MPDTITRKCGFCSNSIEVNRNNITNVLYYKNKYYHTGCFCTMATARAQAKRSTAVNWQAALDNILSIEADTQIMLNNAWAKDDLNEWLLKNYNIAAVPSRFWQIVAELDHGVYKGKKCKAITMETLFGAWKWGQNNLNKINRNNKMNHKGPSNDESRLSYDLAILVNKIPIYLSQKAKTEAHQAEASRAQVANNINYNNMQRTEIIHDGLDDISGLLDEF